MSDKLEIKLNLINQKIDKILALLIKIHDPDHDLSQDQGSDQSDHDHGSDLSDQDLILWFKNELADIGIDPEFRDLGSVIRSIRFFHQKRPTIKNAEKYVMSFLPKARRPSIDPTLPTNEDDLILSKPWYDYPTWEDFVRTTSKLSSLEAINKLNLPDKIRKLREGEGSLIKIIRGNLPDWIDSYFQDEKINAKRSKK